MAVKLGVLGGMGPAATVDFLRKLVAATPASTDQEHVTTVVYSACHIPDRTAAIIGNGPSPLEALVDGIRVLERAGADCVVIPCNTAHYWYPQLVSTTTLPILHIVDAACDLAASKIEPGAKIGVLATAGTLQSGLYQERVSARGFQCVVPDAEDLEQFIMPGISRIKAGDVESARQLLGCALEKLRKRGVSQTILGCTEIPIAFEADAPHGLIDATDALARKCTEWWLALRL